MLKIYSPSESSFDPFLEYKDEILIFLHKKFI